MKKLAEELTPIADNIWTIESFCKMPGHKLPVQATLIQHDNGELTLIAPVKMSEDLVEKIKGMGQVTRVIAPNSFHHLYVNFAKRTFPEAKLICTPALKEKRADIKWDAELATGSIARDLECLEIEGESKFQEFVFFHSPSQTLIVADTLFNLGKIDGWGQIFFHLFGTHNRAAISRLFRMLHKDKAGLTKSLKKVMDWPFEKIVMAHGSPILQDGKAVFSKAAGERGLRL